MLLAGERDYSIPFNRKREDCLRLATDRVGVIEGSEHGDDIVAIDDFCRPTFRIEFLAANFLRAGYIVGSFGPMY
jgi:hypothetical protein